MRALPTSAYAFVTAILVGGVWVGCASETSEPTEEDPSGVEPPPRTRGDDDDKAPRPQFEAGFDDTKDASTDPGPGPGDQCIDKDDPGSAENVAKALPEVTDCEDDVKSVDGVSARAVDVDFYKLAVKDKTFCVVEPDFSSPTAGLELCVYARCKNSTVDAVTGCAAGQQKTSAIGLKGCCAATPGKAVPEWDCEGFSDDDSADFFISVKQNGTDKCLPYKLNYKF